VHRDLCSAPLAIVEVVCKALESLLLVGRMSHDLVMFPGLDSKKRGQLLYEQAMHSTQ
jgi:hypothetical protein